MKLIWNKNQRQYNEPSWSWRSAIDFLDDDDYIAYSMADWECAGDYGEFSMFIACDEHCASTIDSLRMAL